MGSRRRRPHRRLSERSYDPEKRMISGRLIVCIASSWDYDPTCKHHIMKILARDNDVLWINYHGTRRPSLGRVDTRDALGALGRVARGLRRVAPSITQLTPLVIPGARGAWQKTLHQGLLIRQIRRAIRTVTRGRSLPIQLWTFAPDVPYLIKAFNEECSVYYCTDEYRQFEGLDTDHIVEAERELLDRADVVVTTSEPLWHNRRAERPDAALVRHGVDFDHFATAWRSSLAIPKDLADIPRPIFGYFGLVHHWVDRALLAEVARLRPQYSFVILGDCKADVSELERLPNVFLLGRRSYDVLPAYASAFAAGLLLFNRSEMTRSVNPVKMTEYLAAGLPVVSTPLPEARRFEGRVVIADGAPSFAKACDGVLASDDVDRQAISEIVSSETWESTVEQLSEIVLGRMAGVTQTTPQQDRAKSTAPSPQPATACVTS